MAEVNVPLLRKVVEWVEAEAERPELDRAWNQGHWAMVDRRESGWSCGTTTCVAGHVVILEGWQPVMPDPRDRFGTLVLVDMVTKDGVVRPIDELACELLGIPGYDDYEYEYDDRGNVEPHLFDAYNDAKTIRKIAEDIAGERL